MLNDDIDSQFHCLVQTICQLYCTQWLSIGVKWNIHCIFDFIAVCVCVWMKMNEEEQTKTDQPLFVYTRTNADAYIHHLPWTWTTIELPIFNQKNLLATSNSEMLETIWLAYITIPCHAVHCIGFLFFFLSIFFIIYWFRNACLLGFVKYPHPNILPFLFQWKSWCMLEASMTIISAAIKSKEPSAAESSRHEINKLNVYTIIIRQYS